MTVPSIAFRIPVSFELHQVFRHYWPNTVMTYEALQSFCMMMFYTALHDAYCAQGRDKSEGEASLVFAVAVDRRRR